jgi:hypothetical protein
LFISKISFSPTPLFPSPDDYSISSLTSGSLGEIIPNFDPFGSDTIMNVLQILEQFKFVHLQWRPFTWQIFLANLIFSMLQLKIPNGNSFIRAFGVDIHGAIDLTLQTKVRIKTAELIDGSPRIEVFELAEKKNVIVKQSLIFF